MSDDRLVSRAARFSEQDTLVLRVETFYMVPVRDYMDSTMPTVTVDELAKQIVGTGGSIVSDLVGQVEKDDRWQSRKSRVDGDVTWLVRVPTGRTNSLGDPIFDEVPCASESQMGWRKHGESILLATTRIVPVDWIDPCIVCGAIGGGCCEFGPRPVGETDHCCDDNCRGHGCDYAPAMTA